MVNIFSMFLPQLLLYPNATDPLNGDAASLYLQDRDEYYARIKQYVKLYAQPQNLKFFAEGESWGTSDEESEMQVEGGAYMSEDDNVIDLDEGDDCSDLELDLL